MNVLSRAGAALLVGAAIATLGEEGAFDQRGRLGEAEVLQLQKQTYQAKGRRMIDVRSSQFSLMNVKADCKGTLVSPKEVFKVDKKGDFFSKNDIYLAITGSSKGKAKTHKTKVHREAGSKAEFSSSFCFDSELDSLTFKIMDKDWFGDDELGAAYMDAATIESAGTKDDVLISGRKGSKIRLSIETPKTAETPKITVTDPEGETTEVNTGKEENDKPEETKAKAEEEEEPKAEEEKVAPAAKKVPFWWSCPGANKGKKFDRIRKDYNDLEEDEKELYIEAVQVAKTKGLFDIFVSLHKFEPNDYYAHSGHGFYPWHRKFLLEYENMLRSLGEKYKCVTIPFWDWAQEGKVCQLINSGLIDEHKDDSKIRQALKRQCRSFEDVGSIVKDFGGKGDRSNPLTDRVDGRAIGNDAHCVKEGSPFSGPEWKDFEDRKCLARGTRMSPSSLTGRVKLTDIILSSKGDHTAFHKASYYGPHGSPHMAVGGHMGAMWSPADPIFFSHHAFIDKLWFNHQDCHFEKASDKKKVMWTPDYLARGEDTEMPFCFPSKYAEKKRSWVKRNTDNGGGIAAGSASIQSAKDTDYCNKNGGKRTRRRSQQVWGPNRKMDSKMLSSWSDSHQLKDYIDSLDLPGEGNNVMYWPDDYDRHVAKVETSWCTMTKIHKDVMAEASASLLQVQEGSEAHALAQHHANMYNTFTPRKAWGKVKKSVFKGIQKAAEAVRSLNFLRKKVLDRMTKVAVDRDIKAFKEGGIKAAMTGECKDLHHWGKEMKEPSQPVKKFRAWFPGSDEARKEILKKCYDSPKDCELLSACKSLYLQTMDPSKDKCKGPAKAECIKINFCAWLPDPENEKSGKCV